MKYRFHPSAKVELNEAIDYYECRQAGLGEEFAKEVYSAIHRVRQYPEAWPEFSVNTRRCLIRRFPYGVIYQISDNEIVIIAIMHLKREPFYWKNRLK
ncbi:MAG TPA: type II toxin-antitoxin system RelE/ParE family toxin [bacterium]